MYICWKFNINKYKTYIVLIDYNKDLPKKFRKKFLTVKTYKKQYKLPDNYNKIIGTYLIPDTNEPSVKVFVSNITINNINFSYLEGDVSTLKLRLQLFYDENDNIILFQKIMRLFPAYFLKHQVL